MAEMQDKMILIVEDEAAIALPLGDKLMQEGCIVLRASDGEEGLATALREHPDLILADLRMPKKTGLEMIDELRKNAWGKSAKVIIMTNISDTASIEEAARYHAVQYIVKGDNSLESTLEKIHALFGANS